jgi:hypothetical protein
MSEESDAADNESQKGSGADDREGAEGASRDDGRWLDAIFEIRRLRHDPGDEFRRAAQRHVAFGTRKLGNCGPAFLQGGHGAIDFTSFVA